MGNNQAYSQDVASIKKRISFIFLSFIGAVVFCFFNVQKADAYVIYDQLDTIVKSFETGYSYNPPYQLVKSPKAGCLDFATVHIEKVEGTGASCQVVAYPRGVNQPCGTASETITDEGDYTFFWNTSSCCGGAFGQIEANEEYVFTLSCNTGYSLRYGFFGSDTDLYTPGSFSSSTDWGNTMNTNYNGIYDAAMKIGIVNDTSGIEFTNTPINTCDFDYWQVTQWLNASDTLASYNGDWSTGVAMNVGVAGLSAYAYNDNNSLMTYATDYGIRKSRPLQPGVLNYARAYICDSNNSEDCDFYFSNPHILYYSSEYEFTIDAFSACSTTPYVYQGVPQASSTLSGGDYAEITFSCESVNGTIEKGLCNVFKFLFAPSESSFTRFSKLKTSLEDKPPFGYFTAIETVFDSFQGDYASSTTSTAMLSSFSLFSGLEIVKTFRFLLGLILWVLFGWWLFYRIRKFDFKG